MIITIGREFGSGGRYIAKLISERLGVQLYDKALLEEIAGKSGYSREMVEKLDEKPVNFWLSRRIGNYSNSLEENLANSVFDFIRSEAAAGKSFVVVGRCAEYVLRGNPHALRIFVIGDMPEKLKRITGLYDVDEDQAAKMIQDTDKKRRTYHNFYCDEKWGSSRGYDLTINSSRLGVDRTAEVLLTFIDAYFK